MLIVVHHEIFRGNNIADETLDDVIDAGSAFCTITGLYLNNAAQNIRRLVQMDLFLYSSGIERSDVPHQ